MQNLIDYGNKITKKIKYEQIDLGKHASLSYIIFNIFMYKALQTEKHYPKLITASLIGIVNSLYATIFPLFVKFHPFFLRSFHFFHRLV